MNDKDELCHPTDPECVLQDYQTKDNQTIFTFKHRKKNFYRFVLLGKEGSLINYTNLNPTNNSINYDTYYASDIQSFIYLLKSQSEKILRGVRKQDRLYSDHLLVPLNFLTLFAGHLLSRPD